MDCRLAPVRDLCRNWVTLLCMPLVQISQKHMELKLYDGQIMSKANFAGA